MVKVLLVKVWVIGVLPVTQLAAVYTFPVASIKLPAAVLTFDSVANGVPLSESMMNWSCGY